jgi:hypothetical protein
MEDTIGDGAPDLLFRPLGVAAPESESQEASHGGVHAQGLGHALLRVHGAIDGGLMRLGGAFVLGLSAGGHVGEQTRQDEGGQGW